MSNRQPRQPSRPAVGPQGQAVVGRPLAHVTELEFCEHDAEGFAMWIVTRPGRLLCGFCYQAAQLLAGGRGRMSVPDVADLIVIAARVLEIGTGETLELIDLPAAEGALAVHPAGRDELVEDPRTAAGTLSQYANLQTLKTLLQASVTAPATTTHRADPDGANLATTVTIAITSAAPTVGFFRRADVRGGTAAGTELAGDNELQSSIWNDNDITLWPGESEALSVSCSSADLQGAAPVMSGSGCNGPKIGIAAPAP